MHVYSYQTIASAATGLYKEKGSRFLAFAFPVENERVIRERLDELRKEYFDARHHCYAWILGPEGRNFRAYDDGEPNHSAGDPILGQIRSRNLTDVLVVVVRYFGGTKLGVGGLVSAYKQSADDALSQAEIVEREVYNVFHFSFGYDATPEVMRLIKDFNLRLIEQHFDMTCSIVAEVPLRLENRLTDRISLLQATGTKFTVTGNKKSD